MRLRFGSGDLGRLFATCLRTSCSPVLFPASSLASPLTRLDVTFDESVPYYRLFPYRTASLPPPPLFLAPGPPPVDPLPPQGPAPSGVSQVDAVEPVEVAVDSGAAPGAEPAGAGSGGAESGGAGTWGAELGGAEPGGAEPGGAEPGVTEPGGAEPGGAGSARVASGGTSSRREVLSPWELREWFARRWSRAAGAGGAPATTGSGGTGPGGAGATGPGGAAEAAGVGPTGGSAGVSGGTAGGSAGAGTSEGAGAGATGAGGATGVDAPTGSPGVVPAGSGGALRPRPYFVSLLEQVLGLPPSPGPAPPLESPQPVQSQSLFQPVSPLPAPSPYTLVLGRVPRFVSCRRRRLVAVLVAPVVVLRVILVAEVIVEVEELRWLTYLLTDLGEQPRSPPVLYVDNKAMLALCREHRLEHRTKHIALRYFLARELQQRGQLRLAYVASEANTADIFIKALAPGDHQRFCTLLGLVPTWPHLLTS
ncbi:unnamed protein product [Closterium sp. NIES-54]